MTGEASLLFKASGTSQSTSNLSHLPHHVSQPTTHVIDVGPEDVLLGAALINEPEAFKAVARSNLTVIWLSTDTLRDILPAVVCVGAFYSQNIG